MVPKYPRIPHLPWSPGGTRDDHRLVDSASLVDVPLVLSEKMDGSNLCFSPEGVFARTHAHPPIHPSFDLAKALWAVLRGRLPSRASLFGEWLYARHSIFYDALPAYFLLFGVRDEEGGSWWSWDETLELAGELDLSTVPELWRGSASSEGDLRARVEDHARRPSACGPTREGVVVRLAARIADFPASVAKWVREGHVQTDDQWPKGPIVRNRLRDRRG